MKKLIITLLLVLRVWFQWGIPTSKNYMSGSGVVIASDKHSITIVNDNNKKIQNIDFSLVTKSKWINISSDGFLE